ncbi:MAG TPA: sigma-70 family RNA polymerase sigma factor [Terracidiphilus sp.]
MDELQWLADQFEKNRGHLRGVAYRILGSLTEADDAVQESWLRLNRSQADGIENLGGWLTTVVAGVCLDMLRSRNSRREDTLDEGSPEPTVKPKKAADPENEALLADSVGLALLVVLDRLAPAERLAFVLHDMFDLPFEEIGQIVGRSPAAARQLASRARRRVRGGSMPSPSLSGQRKLADAFLAALRAGDFEGLVAVLDPDVVVQADQAAVLPGKPATVRGAEFWARQAITSAHGARAARVALINGEVGIMVAPRGKLFRVLRFTFANGKIKQVDVIADPTHLATLDLSILEG